jgi:orotate phosphoribosyltransferase
MNPNNLFGSIAFNDIILWTLSLATVIFVVDAVGLLPPRFAKWLAQNRLDSTIRALRTLGVQISWDADRPRAGNKLRRILTHLGGSEPIYKLRLREMLDRDTLNGTIDVGERRTFASEGFVDVIGSTTNPETAKRYAQILYAFLQERDLLTFDFVATPKDGSPILGYELALLARRPLVLGVCKKGTDPQGTFQSHLVLDFPIEMTLQGKRALVVDDSTTGGRKVADLVSVLRSQGATITDAAVLFEPVGKGARDLLNSIEVRLHSIVEGPVGRL